MIGQWCNVLASSPHRLSSATTFSLVTLDCITIINYSNFYFFLSLCSLHILYSTYTLSTSFEIFFHFLAYNKLPHCFWLPGTEWKDLSMFAASSTLFHSLSLVHFTPILAFLPLSTYCSVHEWPGYLIQPPVPLPAGVEINRVVVSVLAVPLWSGGL